LLRLRRAYIEDLEAPQPTWRLDRDRLAAPSSGERPADRSVHGDASVADIDLDSADELVL
jgi:hypothetical protein